jgi:hypothetical protein
MRPVLIGSTAARAAGLALPAPAILGRSRSPFVTALRPGHPAPWRCRGPALPRRPGSAPGELPHHRARSRGGPARQALSSSPAGASRAIRTASRRGMRPASSERSCGSPLTARQLDDTGHVAELWVALQAHELTCRNRAGVTRFKLRRGAPAADSSLARVRLEKGKRGTAGDHPAPLRSARKQESRSGLLLVVQPRSASGSRAHACVGLDARARSRLRP